MRRERGRREERGECDTGGERARRLLGGERDAPEGDGGGSDGVMDVRSGWRCGAVIFPARRW